MKRIVSLFLGLIMVAAALTGCKSKASNNITVLSREEGSGTRGAFIELFGIEEKDADGNKVDKTIDTAEITNSTSVMMTSVAGNTDAIGYISLGSLNDTVKALKVDGTEATADNIKNGSYKISRPFNIATKDKVSDVAKDFITFILSDAGQKVVEDNKYISEGNAGSYTSKNLSGKITVGGSTSVTPVMEKLKEAYIKLNPKVTIDIQTSDSTNGMISTADGTYDIGMASRELKDSEKAEGLKPQVIALDGVAVVVNNDNELTDITSAQVKDIYTGNITTWDELSK